MPSVKIYLKMLGHDIFKVTKLVNTIDFKIGEALKRKDVLAMTLSPSYTVTIV